MVFPAPQWGGNAPASCNFLFSTPSLLSHVFLPFAPCGLGHQNNHLHGVSTRQIRELIQFETSCYKSSSQFPAAFHHSAISVCTGWLHRVEMMRVREGRKIELHLPAALLLCAVWSVIVSMGLDIVKTAFLGRIFFSEKEKNYQLMPLVPPVLGKKINPCISR